MTSKHTNGPWKTVKDPRSNSYINVFACGSEKIYGSELATVWNSDDLNTKSNATLISMAPELLDALRVFYASYKKQDSAIPDSDLDNEQPKHVTVPLGHLRHVGRLLSKLAEEGEL